MKQEGFITSMTMTENCYGELETMICDLTDLANSLPMESQDDYEVNEYQRDQVAAGYGAMIGLKHRILPLTVVLTLKGLLDKHPINKNFSEADPK